MSSEVRKFADALEAGIQKEIDALRKAFGTQTGYAALVDAAIVGALMAVQRQIVIASHEATFLSNIARRHDHQG